MNDELVQKLEQKIYAFSVDVFSFVKTLINRKIADGNAKGLLNAANSLYASYLDVMELYEKAETEFDFSSCMVKAEECIDFMKNMELTGALLNEKVDLAIEAGSILAKLRELK
jgi:hypothetical protein